MFPIFSELSSLPQSSVWREDKAPVAVHEMSKPCNTYLRGTIFRMPGFPSFPSMRCTISAATSSMAIFGFVLFSRPLSFPFLGLVTFGSFSIPFSFARPLVACFSRLALFTPLPLSLARFLPLASVAVPVCILVPVRSFSATKRLKIASLRWVPVMRKDSKGGSLWEKTGWPLTDRSLHKATSYAALPQLVIFEAPYPTPIHCRKNLVLSNESIKVELPPSEIWKADVSSAGPSSKLWRRVNFFLALIYASRLALKTASIKNFPHGRTELDRRNHQRAMA